MKITKFILSILFLFLLFSCNNQPTCSDNDTKTSTLKLAEELIIKKLAVEYFIDEHFVKKPNPNILLYADRIGNDAFMKKLNEEIEKEYKNGADVETLYSIHIKNSKNQYLELNPKIENIRIISKENELRKCSCEANLILENGNSLNLFYTVQINEDDETYVEISIEDL